tara:strand:- start:644 stop:940 length:297 start_codon:yes stop_codon:yes gene_type:complete
MLRTSLAVLVLSLIAALPVQAALCTDETSGVSLSFEIQVGDSQDEETRNRLDLMALRQMGVDATRVERWGSCLRAYVRKPDGGEEMQYFNPGSYRRVQ